MKRLFINSALALLAAGSLFSCKPARDEVEITTFLIDSVQSQRIPDKRVAVFSVKATLTKSGIQLSGKTSEPEVLNHLYEHLAELNIRYIDSVVRLPDTSLQGKTWGLITLSVANIRYTAAQSAEMATQALMGTPVRILEESNGYYLIQTPDQYIAWTESAGVAPVTESALTEWKASQRVIFLDDFGLIFSLPESKSDPVSDLVIGGILQTDISRKSSNGFIPVILPDGRSGYLKESQCLSLSKWLAEQQGSPEELIRLAKSFMGRPYLWGGTSGKAFDCSGFTKTLYFLNGWIVSRDASQQVNQGDEIDRTNLLGNLRAGDLLFFGRKATEEKSEKATHVGIYAGDSYMIHCSGLVRINSLDSTRSGYKKYYTENLLHAKRILGAAAKPIAIKDHPWYN